MTIETTTCVKLRCDKCMRYAYDDDDDSDFDFVAHFETREEAVADARRREWIIGAKDLTLCPSCIRRQECSLMGHLWSEWRDGWGALRGGRTRYCIVCPASEHDYGTAAAE